MTITEIIEEALDLFDEPAGTSGKYNQDGYKLLNRLANRFYIDVCKKTGCSRTSFVLKTNPDQREYLLPTDNVGVKKVIFNHVPLIPINEFQADRISGYPAEYYTIDLKTIGINPLPKEIFELTVHYLNKPSVKIVGAEVPALVPEDYHYVIAYGVVMELFKIDKGDRSNGYLKWRDLYQSEVIDMKAEIKRSGRDKFPCLR